MSVRKLCMMLLKQYRRRMIVDWTRIKLAILRVDLKRFRNEIDCNILRKTKDDITISLSKKLVCAIQ